MSDMPEARRLRFERRPSPVLSEHRPLYKIGQLLLVLSIASTRKKSTLPRLQLFNWALKSSVRKTQLLEAAKSGRLTVTAWGFDPTLAVALRIAIAENLINKNSTGYEMAEGGVSFLEKVILDESSFFPEREFLSLIGRKVTEKMVEETAKGWESK